MKGRKDFTGRDDGKSWEDSSITDRTDPYMKIIAIVGDEKWCFMAELFYLNRSFRPRAGLDSWFNNNGAAVMEYSDIAQLEEKYFGRTACSNQLLATLLITLLGVSCSSYSYGADRPDRSPFGVVIGYGASHPGWGGTQERVETIDLALRYESPPEKVKGRRWYKNRHSLVIETPLNVVRGPYDSFMLGVSFLSRWTLERKNIKPYFLVGGGPVYSNANIKGMSSKINGSYQAGVGLEFTINRRRYFVDIRFHHISNGSIREPNVPLNSSKILFGLELH